MEIQKGGEKDRDQRDPERQRFGAGAGGPQTGTQESWKQRGRGERELQGAQRHMEEGRLESPRVTQTQSKKDRDSGRQPES